jgi:ribosomal protein S1
MKKATAIIISVLFIFALAATSFAAGVKQVTGSVTAVDAKANTLTVKGKKGDVAVSTDAKTTVMAGKDKKTLADVKAGDKVTVKYTEADGKNVAKSVSIAPAKAEEKKAPAAAPAPAPAQKPAAAPAKKPASGY